MYNIFIFIFIDQCLNKIYFIFFIILFFISRLTAVILIMVLSFFPLFVHFYSIDISRKIKGRLFFIMRM